MCPRLYREHFGLLSRARIKYYQKYFGYCRLCVRACVRRFVGNTLLDTLVVLIRLNGDDIIVLRELGIFLCWFKSIIIDYTLKEYATKSAPLY